MRTKCNNAMLYIIQPFEELLLGIRYATRGTCVYGHVIIQTKFALNLTYFAIYKTLWLLSSRGGNSEILKIFNI